MTVIQGDTLLTPDQGVTFGSLSIQNGGMQIRQAAATARQALLAEGATKLGVDKDAVVVKDGVVAPKAGGKGVDYAALIGGKDFRLTVDPKAPLKDPKDYTIVGKSVAPHRHSGQGDRTLHLHAGLQAQGHAARARDPARRR